MYTTKGSVYLSETAQRVGQVTPTRQEPSYAETAWRGCVPQQIQIILNFVL